MGIAKDVAARIFSRPIDRVETDSHFKTWRDVLDVFKFHRQGPRMLRYLRENSATSILASLNEESLEDALVEDSREGESVMFLMSGQNDNVINLRSFRRGLRLLNLATSYSEEEIDTLFRKSEDRPGRS